MNKIIKAIVDKMRENDISLYELEDMTGIPKSTLHRYINGSTDKLPVAKMRVIYDALGLDEMIILGLENTRIKKRKIPLLGTIACGTPILATENYDHMIDLPDSVNADFALTCHGDSMIDARIYSGDIVYIRQQPDVDDGQIAAVRIGDEATLKRVYHNADGTVTLVACNPRFAPVVIGKDGDNSEIVGLAVAFLGKIN